MELPRILIVDDSRMVRATIIKRIRDHYEFREEGDGEAGPKRGRRMPARRETERDRDRHIPDHDDLAAAPLRLA